MTLVLEHPKLQRSAHYIGGQWLSDCDRQLDVTNPADGSLITQVPDGRAADGRAAADAAHAAFATWSEVPAKERAQCLKRWNDLVVAHKTDLGRILSREQGKPLAEAIAEVMYAASYIEWFAEEATRANGDVIPASVPGRRMLALREPVGVVAAVAPWNFPAAMIARKIAPALAAGCTVVCKPAEDAPLSALALVGLAEEAGFPAGVLNIVTASRDRTPEVVDAWLDDPRVRKISFTGSTVVGKHLARRSADTLKKVSLELGGNAPFIVFDDADLGAAVQGPLRREDPCDGPNQRLPTPQTADAIAESGSSPCLPLRCATSCALNWTPSRTSGMQRQTILMGISMYICCRPCAKLSLPNCSAATRPAAYGCVTASNRRHAVSAAASPCPRPCSSASSGGVCRSWDAPRASR